MILHTKDPGKIIRWKGKGSIPKKMGLNMKVNGLRARNMDTEHFIGQMEGSILEPGKMVNKMVEVNINLQEMSLNMESGWMESELDGFIKINLENN